MRYRNKDAFDIAMDFGMLNILYTVIIMCVAGAVYSIISMFK